MPPDDSARTFANAPLAELFGVLLRQLKRPLAAQGFTLTDAQADQLARERSAGQSQFTDELPRLTAALAAVVAESEGVLARWGLTFQQSLDTDMGDIPGWETTAEFLDVANEKSNAELRITLSSALALALGGDRRFVPYLLHLAGGDYGDETIISRRALHVASGIDPGAPNGLEQVRAWSKT